MTPADPPDPSPPPHDCPAFLADVQRVLDGDLSPDVLRDPPAARCPDCQAIGETAGRLLGGLADHAPPAPSPDLADRIVRAALRDRRRRARTRWAGGVAALAGAIVVAVYAFTPTLPAPHPTPEVALVSPIGLPPEPPPGRVRTPLPPDRVSDRVAEAGSALAAMTRRVSGQVTVPTRVFASSPEPAVVADPMGAFEPAADSLAAMPNSAKAGLEPMTTGARRALNLFLRDTGLAPKPNS